MPSATVDQMVVQVAGAMFVSVLGVAWLWLADARRWWPFNYGAAVEALLAHGVQSEATRVLTMPGFETMPGLETVPGFEMMPGLEPVAHHHGRRHRAGLRWAARMVARGERRLASRVEHTRRGLRRTSRSLVLVS